jgi:hypothetical protein
VGLPCLLSAIYRVPSTMMCYIPVVAILGSLTDQFAAFIQEALQHNPIRQFTFPDAQSGHRRFRRKVYSRKAVKPLDEWHVGTGGWEFPTVWLPEAGARQKRCLELSLVCLGVRRERPPSFQRRQFLSVGKNFDKESKGIGSERRGTGSNQTAGDSDRLLKQPSAHTTPIQFTARQ